MTGAHEIRDAAIAALCVTLLVCAVIVTATLCRLGDEADEVLAQTGATVRQVNLTASTLNDYATRQIAELSTERNRKAMEATIAAGASFQATARLINTTTIPKINAAVASLDALATQAGHDTLPQATRAISALADTGEALRDTAQAFSTTPQTIESAIRVISDKSQISLNDLHELLSDPGWKEVIRNTAQASAETVTTMRNVSATTDQIAVAATRLPAIAESIQKISATSSRYGKAFWLARILSLIVQAI